MNSNLSLASVRIKAGPNSGKEVSLLDGETIIGRVEPANIEINHPEVSRRHARIVCRDGVYYLTDLGSKNGTQINGEPVIGEHRLSHGDKIELGTGVILTFQ